MQKLSVMEWTNELLQELKSIEDAIDAYNNRYYDTHNLGFIEDNLEEYKYMIQKYKPYLPNKDYGFWFYDVKDNKLVLRD